MQFYTYSNDLYQMWLYIVNIFHFNDFCQSSDTLMGIIFKVCYDYFSYANIVIWMKVYRIVRYLKFLRIFNRLYGWLVLEGGFCCCCFLFGIFQRYRVHHFLHFTENIQTSIQPKKLFSYHSIQLRNWLSSSGTCNNWSLLRYQNGCHK